MNDASLAAILILFVLPVAFVVTDFGLWWLDRWLTARRRRG